MLSGGLPDAPAGEEDRRVRTRKDFLVKTALWLLVLLNLAAIFYFSAQPGPESSRQSRRVAEAAARVLVDGFEGLPAKDQAAHIARIHFPVRKAAHFLLFAALGFLLMLALSRHPLPRARRILLTALACVIYAVLDEAHQALVPERSFTLLDILLDTGGSLLGMALSFLVPSARRAGG